MNNIQNLLAECSASGVTLGLKENKLVVQGRNASVKKLLDKIRRKKAEIMRQLVIDSVAEAEGENVGLSNKAFTDRYLKLTHAHRAGIIDGNTLDEGVTFLLELWQPTQNGNDGNELKTMGTGRCLKLTCDA